MKKYKLFMLLSVVTGFQTYAIDVPVILSSKSTTGGWMKICNQNGDNCTEGFELIAGKEDKEYLITNVDNSPNNYITIKLSNEGTIYNTIAKIDMSEEDISYGCGVYVVYIEHFPISYEASAQKTCTSLNKITPI